MEAVDLVSCCEAQMQRLISDAPRRGKRRGTIDKLTQQFEQIAGQSVAEEPLPNVDDIESQFDEIRSMGGSPVKSKA